MPPGALGRACASSGGSTAGHKTNNDRACRAAGRQSSRAVRHHPLTGAIHKAKHVYTVCTPLGSTLSNPEPGSPNHDWPVTTHAGTQAAEGNRLQAHASTPSSALKVSMPTDTTSHPALAFTSLASQHQSAFLQVCHRYVSCMPESR